MARVEATDGNNRLRRRTPRGGPWATSRCLPDRCAVCSDRRYPPLGAWPLAGQALGTHRMLAYTPAQSAAIAATDGNLQLIACVGSGKDRDVLAGHPVGPAHQTWTASATRSALT